MPAPSRRLEDLQLIPRWTEEDARVAVDALRASGLSAEEFGARYRLHPMRLSRWAARLSSGSLALMPVEVTPAARSALVEVILGTRVLRVPADLDASQLVRLVRAVEAA